MKTIKKARFEGSVLIPLEPLDLPVGTIVEFVVPVHAHPTECRPLAGLVEKLSELPADSDCPPDYAEQIDHYLYGTPKR
jgi:predicted DNA-binding antitoxin AbrB/MazE fold protein